MTNVMNYSHYGSSYLFYPSTCDQLLDDPEVTEKQFNAWMKRRDECCERIDNEAPPNGTHCPLVWDTWDCWNWTEPGKELVQECPWWIPQSNPSRNAVKTCTADGQWYAHPDTNQSWTNYTNCQSFQSTIHVAIFYTGYSISVLSLCFALFIFTYFQSLGCPRVTIHKNLFISFILSGISNITWHITIIIASSISHSEDDAIRSPAGVQMGTLLLLATKISSLLSLEESASGDQTPCRVAFIMAQFFVLCNYFWMLSEGLYLHTVIVVAVFSENHNLFFYYIVGWVLPLVPAGVLLTLLLTHDGGKCWSEAQEIEWVMGGTIIAVLLTNAGLLLNIVRVLVTKLRATPSQGARTYVRAVRATIILLPLMGLHYIILPVRPKDNEVAEIIYDCLIAFLISFQGLFVACIFCFFNGEVINKLHRSIRNFTLVHYSHNANLHNAHGTDGPSETQVKMQIKRKWLSNWQFRRSGEFRTRHTTTTVTEAVSTTPPHSVNLHPEKDFDNYISYPTKTKNGFGGDNGKTKKSVGFPDGSIATDLESKKPLMTGRDIDDPEKTTVV